ncbi:MAG TPA: type II CAAX endopeptidase family protein, partial [Steroidobacteraceae bacterium]
TGEIKAARELYRAAIDKNQYVDYESRLEYFEFERRHGERTQALAAYDQLRNEGFGADILARQRLSLFLAYPGAPWQWRDVAGLLMFLGLLLVLAALPALAVVTIHYRGLARRARGLAPNNASPAWTLRHAWYALGIFTAGGAIALYVFSPAPLEMMLPWSMRLKADSTDIELGHQLLGMCVLALLLALPLLRGRPIKQILVGRWSIFRSIFTGVGLAIALKCVAIIVHLGVQATGVLGNDTMRAMQGAHQSFGMFGMLLIVAVAVPFAEELVFRGVLLEAFRGQVTFVFATIVQAVFFAASHESPADMPTLFVFGLLAGWLAKRSEGLLAPMAMHSAFNLTAALTVVGVTSILNR